MSRLWLTYIRKVESSAVFCLSKIRNNLKIGTDQNLSSCPMHRKNVRLESLSKTKAVPQSVPRRITAEWIYFHIFFPPTLWQKTALQTRRYLWTAMATGTRLLQVISTWWSWSWCHQMMIILWSGDQHLMIMIMVWCNHLICTIRKNSQEVQSSEEPRSRQEDMLVE